MVVDELEGVAVGESRAAEVVREPDRDLADLVEPLDLVGGQLEVDGAEVVDDLLLGAHPDDRDHDGAEDYRAVTVGRLSDAAGLTAPVFYDHFASKRALYSELLIAHAQRLVAATTVVSDDATLADTLHANVAAFFAFVEAHPGAWRMLFRDAPWASMWESWSPRTSAVRLIP